MILISKEEKDKLVELFPPKRPPHYKFPRTVKGDSKRHHYFCVEAEELMRPIADSNPAAAEIVKEFNERRKYVNASRKYRGGKRNGN